MTKFLPVAMVPSSIEILYDLLWEREPHMNISHEKMPSLEEHEAFVKSEPYTGWWLIEDGDVIRGSVYLTDRREVGIFIFKSSKGKGYGTDALAFLEANYGLPLYANIAPGNKASQEFFIRKGYVPCQVTLKKEQ